jgi:hypothetical protein
LALASSFQVGPVLPAESTVRPVAALLVLALASSFQVAPVLLAESTVRPVAALLVLALASSFRVAPGSPVESTAYRETVSWAGPGLVLPVASLVFPLPALRAVETDV